MNYLALLSEIKSIYEQGSNLIQYVNAQQNDSLNTDEAILISYEFQAGSYAEKYKNNEKNYIKYATQISDEIATLLCNNTSWKIMEAGVGEATNFKTIVSALGHIQENCYGFDISWSRVKHAKSFLKTFNIDQTKLSTGNLFCCPYMDNSIDIVYTSHSLEPNGGREEAALRELYRIAKRYVLLFEPGYDFASVEARERMESHGYVQNLYKTAKTLGYNVLEHRLLDFSLNELNPTALLLIEKPFDDDIDESRDMPVYACPITSEPLQVSQDAYYTETSMLMYPVIQNIPCLLQNNAIIGVGFNDAT